MRIPAALVLVAFQSLSSAQTTDERPRRLFVTHCATCHGEKGDGQGVSQLDRPARSFMDGGFSFGNTPEALFRTISTGIPGTPMPGFDSALSEEERTLLAAYVVTLGPPIEEVKDEDMIATVRDQPLIVRGPLPALAEGLPLRPRGLLIGDPSGITFEYRVDDVRLLALRQGGFVRKTDWSGRGGTALEPLGKVVHLIEGGDPQSSFWLGERPLVARLSGTRLVKSASSRPGAGLEYHLTDSGREFAHVQELPGILTKSFGTGFVRYLGLTPGSTDTEIVLRTPAFDGAQVVASGKRESEVWQVVRTAQGPHVWLMIDAARFGQVDPVPARGQIQATLRLKGGETNGATLWTLVLTDWNDEVRKELARWYEEL